MSIKIERCMNKILKIPESGFNMIQLMVMNEFKMVYFIDPYNYRTNANYPIVDAIDDSDTKMQVSFLPIGYLIEFYESKYGALNIHFNNEVEKKKYLLQLLKTYLKDNNINITEYLKNTSYKGILLIYFRKPYLWCDFSKTKDFSSYYTIADDFAKKKNIVIGYNNINQVAPITMHNKNSWLHVCNIQNAIYPLTLIHDQYMYYKLLHFIYYSKNMSSVEYYASVSIKQFLKKYNQFLKSDKKFFMFPMIYNDHFTCCVIDNKNPSDRVCYFFNSTGYYPQLFKKNAKYMFIHANMGIYKNTKPAIRTSSIYYNIDILANKLDDTINTFIFNSFEIQYDSPDCGMFTILFLYHIVNNNVTTEMDFKKVYLSMTYIGDLLASSYRGVLFITPQDGNIMETLDTTDIKNKKFLEFQHMYITNIKRLLNVTQSGNLKKHLDWYNENKYYN